MNDNILRKILLFPFALLVGFAARLRDYLYQKKILKSVQFSLPVIGIGNLSVGGSGKTPHAMYLMQSLLPYIQVAYLSRGYKRKSKGFKMVDLQKTADEVGDEPLLVKFKYPSANVAVSEDRALGIPLVIGEAEDTKVIILDDAFQHRSVQPFINILLTTYDKPFHRDMVMPSGSLREPQSAAIRADMIIVSKCPSDLSAADSDVLRKKISKPHQSCYFTEYIYGAPYRLFQQSQIVNLSRDTEVILLSGLANTKYLNKYVDKQFRQVYYLEYPDHHAYSEHDMEKLKLTFDNVENRNKIILTTEKDAVRLIKYQKRFLELNMPLYVLPIQVSFLFEGRSTFDLEIKNNLLTFKS